MKFFVGTYTGPNSQGIYVVDLDPATGKLSEPTLAGETKNPSFITLHPTKPLLFAALEIGEFEGQKTGAVQAFSIDTTSGKLTPRSNSFLTIIKPAFRTSSSSRAARLSLTTFLSVGLNPNRNPSCPTFRMK